jgi:uncharacterized protein (DUF1800 family)
MLPEVTAAQQADPAWAWAPYEPDSQRPWTIALAAHLYRRAGFGAGWETLQRALAEGPQRTVDRLVRPDADVQAFNKAFDAHEGIGSGSAAGLRAWWLRRMMETPYPLLEKMTLFWRNHFAFNAEAVKDVGLMQGHIGLLRSHALGSFSSLLGAIWRDPALLTALGADSHRRASPNDALVRPLMGAYTLGKAGFTEQDVHEAARAFSGWFVLRGELRWMPGEEDRAGKCVLGWQGDWAADDVIRILLEQPATSERVVRQMHRWLLSEARDLDQALVMPLAKAFAKDYDVARLAETMLRSNLFFSSWAYRARIKSPVEVVVGIAKAMEAVAATVPLAQDVADLGQDPISPPTVEGWQSGLYWITTASLVRRHNLALAMLQGKEPYGGNLDPWPVAQRHGCTTRQSAAQFLLDLLVQGDLEPAAREALLREAAGAADEGNDLKAWACRLAHGVMTQPEFQLA